MSWIERYRAEVDLAFAEAAEEMKRLPPPLRAGGLELLARVHPSGGKGGTNYICYLLPFWMRTPPNTTPDRGQTQRNSTPDRTPAQTAPAPSNFCRDLAVGNLLAMLHFFMLDDAMDAADAESRLAARENLALGQLLHSGFLRRYYRHFPAASTLWNDYETYLAEWAAAVADEGKTPADPSDVRRLARKSSPLKLCAAGMLIRSGREQLIAPIGAAIELVLATLQLADDWTDWRDDLSDERCNAFLTLARQTLSVPPDRPLDEQSVKQAIYRGGCLRQLSALADANGDRLRNMPHVPDDLIAFHGTLAEGIRRDALAAEQFTDSLALGGLSCFLSNYEKI